MDSMINQKIGRYEILEELGRGGMAVAYKAVDTTLGRNVAIKLILPGQQQTDHFIKRFLREARSLAQLSHPNIVTILDSGDYEGSPYLVMEYIPGGSLTSMLGKPISASEAANLIIPIAYALHHAHRHKIIHRDVKPSNVLINSSGQPMLTDFGIVKLMDTTESQGLTGTGAIVGTPSYMAPEQIKGQVIDGRADVYALGVIFYEMVTGQKPYTANTPIEVTLKHINAPIPKPRLVVRDIPQEAEAVIYKAMAKNPDSRYADMLGFITALEKVTGKKYAPPRIANQEETEQKKPDTQKEKRKIKSWVLIGGALGGLLLVAGLIYSVIRPSAPLTIASPTTTQVSRATATNTPVPSATVKPSETPISPTETPVVQDTPSVNASPLSEKELTKENSSRVIELARPERIISVIQLAYAPDGSLIIDAGSKMLYLIEPVTLKILGSIELGSDIPKAVTISSDSTKVYVLVDNWIRLFDINTKKRLASYSVPGGTNSMALSSDNKYISIGVADNKAQLLSAKDGSVVRKFISNFGGWSAALSPESNLTAVGTTMGALMWETETGVWKPLKGGDADLVKSLSFSPDGKWLLGGTYGKLIVWDIESGEITDTFVGDYGGINSISISPSGTLIAVGCDDTVVRLLDLSPSGKVSSLAELKGHTSPVLSVVFSPDGEYVTSGANEGVVRLWGLP